MKNRNDLISLLNENSNSKNLEILKKGGDNFIENMKILLYFFEDEDEEDNNINTIIDNLYNNIISNNENDLFNLLNNLVYLYNDLSKLFIEDLSFIYQNNNIHRDILLNYSYELTLKDLINNLISILINENMITIENSNTLKDYIRI